MSARPEALDPERVERKLRDLDGWKLEDEKLHRDFKFANFIEAFGFMTQVAIVAEKMDHHPEWSNGYNRVRVDLTTPDAKGITELDFSLAATMNEIAGR